VTILEMITEWRKGCSNADSKHPEECLVCTRGLIDAIERQLRAPQPNVRVIGENQNPTG
jgi:hypothetical protein